ncbi:MAG TPA: DUF4157 domain-containing protein [Pyrinomonadaceae bacterium]|jgi:hypothetical protein|nr:DUF4157 domain-containing protein [Pyrinomonadaceae bacterium]
MPNPPTRTTRTTAPPTPSAAPSRPARPSPARAPAPSPVARRAAPPAVRLPPTGGASEAVHVHPEGAAAEHAIRPTGLADFAGTAGPGEPLPQAVRPQLEETFGVSLEGVRVHTDARSADVASSLSARAFTYGTHIFLGPRERPTDMRLIAHETAHVVQQQGGTPTPQPLSEGVNNAYEREAERASAAAVGGERFTVQERTPSPRVQRLGLSDILDGLADLAANVPGFTLLTVIIGRNPINMRAVERNFTNLLRGFMGLIPGGELLFQILNRYGVVERIGRWVSDEVASLGLTFDYLRRRFTDFTGSLGWRDIFSPGDVWRRARNIFTEPVNRITAFVSRLISQAITWLKETFMQPLSDFARRIPGYTLVTVLLGRDPFTGAPVDRSPLNLVRAFAEFIPGGAEKVNQLVESRALQRAYDWFIQETRARNLTWDRVTGTFAQAWNSLRLEDVLHPIDTIARIADIFRPLMGDLVGFAGAALMKLLELIFEAAMGAGGARVLAILKRAQATFNLIIRDPVGFLRNLLGAVGQGVRQFMTNILRHLQQGVIAWLTGPVARAGVQMPERWDMRGIVWFVMQILGLTWDRVRQKLVRVLGERTVAMLESGFQLIQDIRQRGLVEALRERVTEFFGQLQEAALGGIRSFIQRQLVRAGIMQLLSLLNPVGAVIQAIVKTYTTIQFFIQRINQILDLVESVLNSIAAIAAGSVSAAAGLVERTMARTIPVILDFLARFIGLGDVGAHVQRTIQSLQERVDQMLDRAVAWISTMAQRVGTAAAGAARAVVSRLVDWLGLRKAFQTDDGESHSLYVENPEQPTLMLATRPQAFEAYLRALVVPSSDRPRTQAKQRAIRSHQQINTKLTELKNLERTFGAGPTSAQRGQLSAKQAEIRQLYDTLTDQVKILGVGGTRPETVVTRIDPAAGSKLGRIEAKPLTALRGNTVGNPAANSVAGVPGWAFLDRINIARGPSGPSVYNDWVRWHLIHSGLHGPAAVFNLVAAPRTLNTRHEALVERQVLRRVLEPGTMLYMKVDIEYGNARAPLSDFPTAMTYTWGTMRMNNRNQPVEDRQLGRQPYSGFPRPSMPGRGGGPLVIIFKNIGRPFMQRTLGIPQDAARRIAAAITEYPNVSVRTAMRRYYNDPTSLFRDTYPYSNYLANDWREILDAQTRHSGTYTFDLS